MKKIPKTKTASSVALILLLSMSLLFVAFSASVQALDIPTYLLITAAPDPVGKNQAVYINAFLSKPPPTASGPRGDRYEDITIQITTPSGLRETKGPYYSDSTGGVWLSYNPTEVGTYTVQAFYPGQILVGSHPATPGNGTNLGLIGSYMQPSTSAIVAFVVQEAPILSYSSPPLPTGYWSRPIYTTNFAWGQLGGNWFGLRAASFATSGMYDAVGNLQLYSTAPNTGHIVWTKPTKFGGQVGAPFNSDQESQYTSTSILFNHWEPIIIYGILYYVHYPTIPQEPRSWEAVDLRTGKTVWSMPPGITGDEILRMGQVMKFHTIQEYGSFALLWSVPRTGTTVFRIYDATTGEYLANVTGARNDQYIMDFDSKEQGTLLGHYVSGGNLTLWNSTQMLGYPSGRTAADIDQRTFRPSGNYTYSAGISWTVQLPTTVNGVPIGAALSIGARTSEVILLRYAPTPGSFLGISDGYQITAGYDTKTGRLLWGPLNQTLPRLQDISLLAARDGVYVLHNKDTNEAYGYSLTNGQKLWGPVKLPGNAWSTISRAAEIAYGKVYIWDFGGYVNALDFQTGQIKWTVTPRSAGYDTPYGKYTLWHFGTHSIADGKLFLSEGHMYNPPIFPNAQRLAINCSTGEIVWSVLSFSGRMCAAHADGYMVEWNSYDCQLYTFGKGPTLTSVTIQNDVITHGSSVLIKGSVMDDSPGTKDSDRSVRFPNGVPAVADEYMSPWMEYVYMQQPKPTDITGIPVHLTAIDPNNNIQHIGTVTTDSDGNFAILWAPPVPGIYTVKASFDGSKSYYDSYGKASFGVLEAQAASPSPVPAVMPTTAPTVMPTSTPQVSPSVVPAPEAAPAIEMYIIAVATTVIMAVVATAALTLRRRK